MEYFYYTLRIFLVAFGLVSLVGIGIAWFRDRFEVLGVGIVGMIIAWLVMAAGVLLDFPVGN